MRNWLRKHPIIATLLWTALALAGLEGTLVYYYLNSWLTLPLL